jgi:hypothetical protein
MTVAEGGGSLLVSRGISRAVEATHNSSNWGQNQTQVEHHRAGAGAVRENPVQNTR